MKVNDVISGMIVSALALFLFFYSGTFVSMPGVPYGPSLFPKIISVFMGMGGLILIVFGIRSLKSSPLLYLDEWAKKKSSYHILFGIIGSMFFYILASPSLGFLITVMVMLIALLTLTRGVSSMLSNLVIASIFSSLIFAVFSFALRVPLPIGAFEKLLLGYS